MKKTTVLLLGMLAGISACGEESFPALLAASPQRLGPADDPSGDLADYHCAVVLRSVGRIKLGPGFATTCDLSTASQDCRYVWEGRVDVSEAAASEMLGLELLFSTSASQGQWHVVSAQATGPAQGGFVPHRFVIDQLTPSPGMSFSSLDVFEIELIPYLRTASHMRLFDHNRVKHPMGSYRLHRDNGWAVGEAPAICAHLGPPRAVDWAGSWQLHAGRSGFVFPLSEPYSYQGYTNMGYSIGAEVYAAGLTDQLEVDDYLARVLVESDLIGCQPGGPLQRAELYLADTHVGPYQNNSLYRWGVEGPLLRCPKGTYRYRFLISADGGQSYTPLGNAASTDEPNASTFRTIDYH